MPEKKTCPILLQAVDNRLLPPPALREAELLAEAVVVITQELALLLNRQQGRLTGTVVRNELLLPDLLRQILNRICDHDDDCWHVYECDLPALVDTLNSYIVAREES